MDLIKGMKEIRFHGRGGQGVVTAADVLAMAAFYDGKFSQAFPSFGVERRGAPVTAFARIDSKPIRRRSQIYEPDYVIVQDPSLIGVVDVASGLREGAVIIINSAKKVSEFPEFNSFRVYTVDATKIALEHIGKPIVNMPMLGAFSKITKEVTLESLRKAIRKRFEGKEAIAEKNIKAMEEIAEKVEG